MQRKNFLLAVEKYNKAIVKKLTGRGCEQDMAEDAVQNMVVSMLANKSYIKYDSEAVDSKAHAFLRRAASVTLRDALKKIENDNKTIVDIISETDDVEKADDREVDVEKDEAICPYCHNGELNLYKACSECGTIVGQGRNYRKHISIDEEALQYTPDLDKEVDVNRAMATLDDIERKVMLAVVNKHDTLEGLADVYGMSRPTLDKIYVRAKHKLQLALLDYASEYAPSASETALKVA